MGINGGGDLRWLRGGKGLKEPLGDKGGEKCKGFVFHLQAVTDTLGSSRSQGWG